MPRREERTAQDMYRLGGWTFLPGENEIRQGAERRRLEDRAARTLALLCRRAGGTVSNEEIVAAVWNGRSQSPNSVAVVISQLRKALGDDARRPALIETVPKRGYRVTDGESRGERHANGAARAAIGLALALLVAAALWSGSRPTGGAPVAVSLEPVENATGAARYAPLAAALGELIATRLPTDALRVVRGNGAGADVRLVARLVLWNGEPTLALSATRPSGELLWSHMARGPEARLAATSSAAIDAFAARMRTGVPPAN